MLKQQQQLSTEHQNLSDSNYSSLILGRKNSQSFKQRINRLKAKIKPCIHPIQFIPQSPTTMSESKLKEIIMQPSLTSQKQKKIDRMLSQTKVVTMRVSFRKETFLFKTKYKDRKQVKQKQGKNIHFQNEHSLSIKLNLKILQKLKNQQGNDKQIINMVNKCSGNKQNQLQNGCQIEDILINSYKSPITTQRGKLKTKAQKSSRKTTIDVRQCSARNATEYNINRKDKSGRGNGNDQLTGRHLKTQSQFYKIK